MSGKRANPWKAQADVIGRELVAAGKSMKALGFPELEPHPKIKPGRTPSEGIRNRSRTFFAMLRNGKRINKWLDTLDNDGRLAYLHWEFLGKLAKSLANQTP